ncbi:MAG: hypothetical protein ABIN48_14600 [Ginsengibacter sp.]
MKKVIITILLSCFVFFAKSQIKQSNEYLLKLSGGHVTFGSGDFFGYSVSLDASKNVIKNPSFALNKLLIGAELIFDNGVKNPPISSINSFYHVSSTVLWPKASYYPFNKLLSGLNIQLGPTIGYSYRSQEGGFHLYTDALGNLQRDSKIIFDNGHIYGYRISASLEFNISKKFFIGPRVDWSNNNEAEINTLLGLGLGLKL